MSPSHCGVVRRGLNLFVDFRQSITSLVIVIRSYSCSRRQFLAGAAGALGAVALAGCGAPSQSAKAAKAVTASYRTRPDLKAPLIRVTGPAGVPAPGYLFVTPGGPLIVDNVGSRSGSIRLPHASTNLRVQRYRGQPVLSWSQGEVASYGVGQEGEYVVMDDSYRQIMRVKARHGLPADLHEFLITGDGTAYFTAYETFTTDLRGVNGPKSGTALDATIQGVDLGSFRRAAGNTAAPVWRRGVWPGHPSKLRYRRSYLLDPSIDVRGKRWPKPR